MRPSGRAANILRPVSLTPGFARHAEGSCLTAWATPRCSAPPASKAACRRSCATRPGLGHRGIRHAAARHAHARRARGARGRQSGRTQEIQRLIGRALRAVVDRSKMGEGTMTLDCDV